VNKEKHIIDVAIWRVSHHHRYLVRSRLESLGLYRGQHRMIWMLEEEDGRTHSQLAEHMRISNATVSKMVQRMEQNGFVERRADKKDQRISRVFLTTKGREISEQLKAMFNQLEIDETVGFSEEELDQLKDYLERLNNNLKRFIPHHQKEKKKEEVEE